MTKRLFLTTKRLGLRSRGHGDGRVLSGRVHHYHSRVHAGLSVEVQVIKPAVRHGYPVVRYGVTCGGVTGTVREPTMFWPAARRKGVESERLIYPEPVVAGEPCRFEFEPGRDECRLIADTAVWEIQRISIARLRVTRPDSDGEAIIGPGIGLRVTDAPPDVVAVATLMQIALLDVGFSVNRWVNLLAACRRPLLFAFRQSSL